jgi:hypothetical protein
MANKDPELQVLGMKIDQLALSQHDTAEKVSDIRERVLNPEVGYVAQARDASVKLKLVTDEVLEVKKDIDKLVEACADTNQSLSVIESWVEDHEEQDTNLRKTVEALATILDPIVDDFKIRASRKKWTDRVVWLILSTLILTTVPAIKYVFFDASRESERLDQIEKKLEKRR